MRFHQGLLLLLTGLTFFQKAYGQDRCGFDAYQEKLLKQNSKRSEVSFEQWMKEKIREQKLRNLNRNKTATPTYTLPVVVHVIHNGEPVGSGKNISNAQVQSQIDVLNQDFQRLNADTINTPAQFLPAAGSIDIKFVLAKQDPDGLPTNGILRVKGTKPSWTFDDAFDSFGFKSLSYWPAENYLNIWVVAFSDGYLGIAQFPVSSLQGVEGPYDPQTDGVCVDYTAFGTTDAGSFNLDPRYDKGRSTTHEIGHFFSLLHIFGKENGCSSTDYVDDTPSQDTKTLTCPTHPNPSCGHNKMFQNYLDYTDDACMNLFTAGQVDRIITVLENSPRRNSLLSSPGATDPILLSLDLEAKKILSPTTKTCGQFITPKLEIRNRGTTKVTAARVQFLLNSVIIETRDFTLDLDQLDIVALSFGQINLAEPSTNAISFKILQVNGGSDEKTSNDTITLSSQVASRIIPPIVEVFNSIPSSWQLVNPDNNIGWQNRVAPNSVSSNRAMTIDLYNYASNTARDQLISPVVNLAGADFPVLRFDYAYARFPGNNLDSLRILALPGCSNDISQAVEIDRRGGTLLSTSSNTSIPFIPSNETQWKSWAITLTDFAGENVQLIFESINGNGNNLYIDNVQVQVGDFFDVAVSSLISPGPVVCLKNVSPVLQVQNLGSDAITRVEVTTQVNGVTTSVKTFNSLNLLTGSANDLSLDPVTLVEGENSIVMSVSNPDAGSDEFPENNSLEQTWVLNDRKELVPHRQNFEKGLADWTVISQGTQKEWEPKDTNFGSSMVYKAFTNTNIGEQAWLVSPILDFSRAITASLFLESSYGSRSAGSERFRILASEDCGEHFDQVLFDKMGDQLANEITSQQWIPGDETDWRTEYVSLNDLAGKGNVRFAFVITNDNGNDLYLDNIEWYMDDNPNPPKIADFFSVYYSDTNPYDFKITFNLPEKDMARLVVYNTMGQVLIDNLLPETLNQTYTINLFGQSTGVYIARLQAGGKIGTTKLFIGK